MVQPDILEGGRMSQRRAVQVRGDEAGNSVEFLDDEYQILPIAIAKRGLCKAAFSGGANSWSMPPFVPKYFASETRRDVGAGFGSGFAKAKSIAG